MNRYHLWKPLKGRGGFTLIEMSIVIFLMGMILSLVLPRIQDAALSDNLKNTASALTSAIKEIRYQAVKDCHEYSLMYNFESREFSADFSGSGGEEQDAAPGISFSLPSGISVMDISFKDGAINTAGEIGISISKEGYIMPSVIHLASEDGRKFSFITRPFLGDAGVIEEYIEIGNARL